MTSTKINRASIAICLITAVTLALLGAGVGLSIGVGLVWLGSLWLAQPLPELTSQRKDRGRAIPEEVPAFLEPVNAPLLIVSRNRVVAANRAARDAVGAHVIGQDVRVGLRHPDVVALIDCAGGGQAEIKGLTTPRSLWQVDVHDLGQDNRLVALLDLSSQSDVARAHTDFVANASHELKTPLASIIGYIETLMDAKAGGNATTRAKFLDTMEREARRMASLVNDLISLSRIEAEKHDVPQDRVALIPLISGIAKELAALGNTDRVRVEFKVEVAETFGDRLQIDQVLRNLIDNALKYGDINTPVIVSVAEAPGKQIALTISDTGPGIPPEHLPHLTRRFYRTDPGRSRAAGGTGLGLAIVKHIVERHQGQLDIASKMGKGTTVTIRLPRAG
jgi:two-component system, OmpR family, phosphate regulon sensor histidine kinase PhoR